MTTIEDSINYKITRRITPFTSIKAVEHWNIEKLIKILYSDNIILLKKKIGMREKYMRKCYNFISKNKKI